MSDLFFVSLLLYFVVLIARARNALSVYTRYVPLHETVQVMPILDQLEKEYSMAAKDWCSIRSDDDAKDRAHYVSTLLSKHMEYKERFLKVRKTLWVPTLSARMTDIWVIPTIRLQRAKISIRMTQLHWLMSFDNGHFRVALMRKKHPRCS